MDVKEKGVPDGYGDYVGWAQLQEIARAEKRGVIFVTDDFKSDWWYIEGSRTLGPRPELPKEFAHACNQEILFYNSESFLRDAKKFAAADIGEYTIEEVRRRIESQQESQVSAGLKPPQGDTALQDKQSRGIDSEVQPVAGLKPTVSPTPGTGPTKLPEEDK